MWHAGSYLLNQGSNLCPLHWEHGVLTTGLPGKPLLLASYHTPISKLTHHFCLLSCTQPLWRELQGLVWGIPFPGGSDGNKSTCNAGDLGSIPDRKILWRRGWLPMSIFLPGEFHGQRSLTGYIVHGIAESDTTEWLTLPLPFFS